MKKITEKIGKKCNRCKQRLEHVTLDLYGRTKGNIGLKLNGKQNTAKCTAEWFVWLCPDCAIKFEEFLGIRIILAQSWRKETPLHCEITEEEVHE